MIDGSSCHRWTGINRDSIRTGGDEATRGSDSLNGEVVDCRLEVV